MLTLAEELLVLLIDELGAATIAPALVVDLLFLPGILTRLDLR